MKEPKEYRNNVHFWLRKIFYFVHFADVRSVGVLTEEKEKELMREQGEDPEKGEAEAKLRGRLNEKEDIITKEEAEEACLKLYEMFNMPLDDDVLKFMEDRRCAGGQPRCV